MAYAVSQEYSSWGEGFIPAAHLGIGTFEERRKAGLRSHVWTTNRRRDRLPGGPALLASAGNVLPSSLRRRYELVSDRDVDVILDASGFAFSDQWGPAKAQKMARLCSRWKAAGKRVVLLPQAFGPFSTEPTRTATRAILRTADLVFARDESSYEALHALGDDASGIRLAPDFTNLLNPVPSSTAADLAGRACIIPNIRMLDKTGDDTSNAYLEFLVRLVRELVNNGHRPFLLIHEKTDRPLAEQVRDLAATRHGCDVEVVARSSALELKAIIGSCSLVVGSRFHALVSALSQSVPSIATGWSHKYLELFRDYGVEEYVVPVSASADEALVALKQLDSNETYEATRLRLSERAETQKAGARKMWEEVRRAITG